MEIALDQEEILSDAEPRRTRDTGKNRQNLKSRSNSEKNNPEAPKPPKKGLKRLISEHKAIFIIILLILLASIAALIFFLLNMNKNEAVSDDNSAETHYYSILSGEEIADESLNQSPTFCVQIPNGTDGARPQVGLNKAPVVFEAIAEAGITRFAAIFQNLDDSAIGPIRSLRSYYLQWDTPFDCTVVHAGGSDEALADLKSGNYRDLTENTTYMWRDNSGYPRPNNLFTSAELLNKFNTDNDITKSDPKAFPRLKPDEAAEIARDNHSSDTNDAANDTDNTTSDSSKTSDKNKTSNGDKTSNDTKSRKHKRKSHKHSKSSNKKTSSSSDASATSDDTVEVTLADKVEINFTASQNFNLVYTYNSETNSYDRAYANGKEHTSYTCPAGSTEPKPKKDCGDPVQLSPKVVIAMEVQQFTASDGYHLDTTTTGSGKAYIFQNGEVVIATWHKANAGSQIEFKDDDGDEISFTPGQLWISAIPTTTGSVKYE